MRRGSFQDDTVDYAAVGATQAHDLMSYPPENSVPTEHSWLLGSGQARFESSADALLSWTALRGAGLTISDVRPAAGPMYTGVGYDVDGNPMVASRLDADQRFDADGTWPQVGDRVALGISHPCTTFDKWRWLALIDDDGAVTGAISTRF